MPPPGRPVVNSVRPASFCRSAYAPMWLRTVRKHSRYVPEATRKEGMRHLAARAGRGTSDRRAVRHDFGRNVSVSVFQVSLRSSLSQAEAFAVYISPYPRWSLTTKPRSIDRYLVPPST